MATRKQKHAAALERHEEFMAQQVESGQRAIAASRADRERESLAEWQENHDKNHSWKKRIPECPHCQLEMKEAGRPAHQEESSNKS